MRGYIPPCASADHWVPSEWRIMLPAAAHAFIGSTTWMLEITFGTPLENCDHALPSHRTIAPPYPTAHPSAVPLAHVLRTGSAALPTSFTVQLVPFQCWVNPKSANAQTSFAE